MSARETMEAAVILVKIIREASSAPVLRIGISSLTIKRWDFNSINRIVFLSTLPLVFQSGERTVLQTSEKTKVWILPLHNKVDLIHLYGHTLVLFI